LKLRSGASRIVKALELEGVRCVFGLPGTQTIELFEMLRQRSMRTVVATNELSACFMAGGWARVSGEPGILITISGPGFTWALTGVAEARLDSVPLVHIVGSPPVEPVTRRFRQQDIPHKEIASALYKSVIDADSFADLAQPLSDAIALAKSGEPGPVLLLVSATALQLRRNLPTLGVKSGAGHREKAPGISDVATRFANARRPILLVGRGTIHHAAALRKFVERVYAPVITTPSARGVLPENHPLNIGFRPLTGHVADANSLLESTDLVLAIGCKLSHSDTSGFEMELAANRLIHFDASSEVIAVNYPSSLGVVGDSGELLDELLRHCTQRSSWTNDEVEEWRKRLAPQPSASPEPAIAGTTPGTPEAFFDALRSVLPEHTMLVLDSGLHQVVARRYYSVLSPHGLLMPTGLQSMGFAIPTAIGARLALPHRPVIALLGDGGLAMTALELLSATRENVPMTVILFADGAFGQIRLQQLASYGISHGVMLNNPNFSLLAASLGIRYEAVTDGGDIAAAVRRSLNNSGVTLIEVTVSDAFPIRRVAATALAREVTRRAGGAGVLRFIAKVFRRG
jgi:acetolactate synthase I/II/III large subunit